MIFSTIAVLATAAMAQFPSIGSTGTISVESAWHDEESHTSASHVASSFNGGYLVPSGSYEQSQFTTDSSSSSGYYKAVGSNGLQYLPHGGGSGRYVNFDQANSQFQLSGSSSSLSGFAIDNDYIYGPGHRQNFWYCLGDGYPSGGFVTWCDHTPSPDVCIPVRLRWNSI